MGSLFNPMQLCINFQQLHRTLAIDELLSFRDYNTNAEKITVKINLRNEYLNIIQSALTRKIPTSVHGDIYSNSTTNMKMSIVKSNPYQ